LERPLSIIFIQNGFEQQNASTVFIAMPPFSYTLAVKALKPGESTTEDLSDFTKDSGARFDPNQYRVTEVWIGGADYDYKEYGSQ
jgi:hypothetical protein